MVDRAGTAGKVRHDKSAGRSVVGLDLGVESGRERYYEIFVVTALVAFGIYLSVLYFGHQVVPNSDFPAFVGVGKSILRFDMPGSFKRVPVLGILQVILSKVVGGRHPELTAGWLLNGILYPLTLVLLYLVGKRVIGKSAVWFALPVIINPWSLALLVQPIVETTLVFFTLLTIYFIFRRSRWCYVFACLTSMVRYEGAALILVIFVLDMFESKGGRARLMVLVRTGLASLPLALWMGCRYFVDSGERHYICHFTQEKHIGTGYLKLLWETTFMPLFQLPGLVKAMVLRQRITQEEIDAINILFGVSKFIAAAGVIIVVPYGLYKRSREHIALVIFFVCYISVHSLRMVSMNRYCVPIIWETLLLSICGLICFWRVLNWKDFIPRLVIVVLQIAVSVAAGIWMYKLIAFLPKAAVISERSESVCYAGLGLVVLILLGNIILYKGRYLAGTVAVSMVVGLMVVSNQFVLVRQLGGGKGDMEFKELADWYVENAKPGEKMVTTMPHIVKLYAPSASRYFLHPTGIKGENANDFTANCYKRNVTYIAWDSRIGLSSRDAYYKRWRIGRIGMLKEPRSIGPYEFVKQIKRHERRYVNIFRLRQVDSGQR